MLYKHPGVYIEHVPSGMLSIEAAATSIAAFIGPVKRGPVGEPVFISNAGQFEEQFGVLGGGAGGVRNEGDDPDRFGFAVNAFFANGGGKAYIVRVAEDGATAATDLASAVAVIPDPDDPTPGRGFEITAVNAGVWGNAIVVRLSPTDPAATPDLTLGYTLEVGIEEDGDFVAIETFTGVETASDAGQSIEKVVAEGSALINIEGKAIGGGADEIADVTSDALRGGTLTLATSGMIEIANRGVDITVDGDTVTVTFEKDTADFDSIADRIQTVMRAESTTAPDFTARIEVSGANRNLLLMSGLVGASGAVTAAAPTAPATSALSLLALAAATATAVPLPPTSLSNGGTIEAWLSGGVDGEDEPDISKYVSAYTTLRDYRDVSILLLPALNWVEGGDNSIIQRAVTHCEFMKNRMVVVDPPNPVGSNRLVTPKDVKDLGATTSPYAALYYPWLEVSNPHYDPDTAANLPRTFAVPPSAFAAGMWARIDGTRGVWKAPAGLEATVRGSIGPNVLIGNDLQDNLNEWGVNCLRAIIGPTVIWGARTLATKTKPQFRYVPIRRTQNMIGESLYIALQAVVFEPNDYRLWGSLRASVGGFMDTLHRAGAFQGEKASDAYFVRCDLGSTMTQADVDAGVVRVVVGFAPLKPAEFVVVQIKQIVGRTA